LEQNNDAMMFIRNQSINQQAACKGDLGKSRAFVRNLKET